jgi:hypothetical protein
LNGPFPALVLEKADASENLGVRTVLNSLSATEFCMQLSQPVALGEELLVITQLSHAILLLRGEVTKVQQPQSGSPCLSLRIKQHQIFSALAGNPSLERFSIKDLALDDARIHDAHPDYVSVLEEPIEPQNNLQ